MEATLIDIALDQALPTIRKLAQRKANAFVQRCRLAVDEREDIASHLVLVFIARWPKFNSNLASVQTFASRLMDKELISILRYRLAQCRQPGEPQPSPVGPASAAIHQFRVDFERAMASLPEVIRETAFILSWCSTVDAANALGCSRQMIGRRKHQIREAFHSAGITSRYFAGEGSRQ
jgi:RNA polymerase sigma-70 factor (ECF subfamily)